MGEFATNALFAGFLMSMSLVLLVRGAMSSKSINQAEAPEERKHLLQQFYRRRQVNFGIGLIGLAILGGSWVTVPWMTIVYWLVVIAMVACILYLVVIDMNSTRSHLVWMQSQQRAARAELEAELRRIREQQKPTPPLDEQ